MKQTPEKLWMMGNDGWGIHAYENRHTEDATPFLNAWK